jgi:uncharacterized protein
MMNVDSTFRRIRSAFAGVAVAALLAGCVSELSPTAGGPETAAAPAPAAGPPLWVVRDADSTIYLFGTFHALKGQTKWRTPAVEAALAESQEVWLEIADVGDSDAMQAQLAPLIAKIGVDPANPLSSKLTAEERAKLAAAAQKAGLNPAQLEPLRPWLAAVQLSIAPLIAAGYDPNLGVDKLISAAAKAAGKPLMGFETTEQQLRFFASFPPEVELQFLREAIEANEDGPAMVDDVAAAWAAGDMQRFKRLFIDDLRAGSPELYRVMIVDRNEAWAKTLQERLRGSGVSFVAVGAGHLVGPDSVQARLKARGIDTMRK